MICFILLYVHENDISVGYDKRHNFPIDPHCKKIFLLHNVMYMHDVAKVCDFYNGGLLGFFSFFVVSN